MKPTKAVITSASPADKHLPLQTITNSLGESKPTLENALNQTYPITRPLMIYTIGEPEGRVKAYIDWIFSEDGQKIVVDKGYVPLPKK